MARANEYTGTFIAYRAALIKVATPIVGCRMHAEDVVQEAFLRLTDRVNSANPIRHPVAFIFQVVRHLALDRSRQLRLETRYTTQLTPLCRRVTATAFGRSEVFGAGFFHF